MDSKHAIMDNGDCLCGYSSDRATVLRHVMTAWAAEDAEESD